MQNPFILALSKLTPWIPRPATMTTLSHWSLLFLVLVLRPWVGWRRSIEFIFLTSSAYWHMRPSLASLRGLF